MTNEMLRAPAEAKYADELEWLESVDEGPKPFSWRLSPRMVRLFVLGSERSDGLDREISHWRAAHGGTAAGESASETYSANRLREHPGSGRYLERRAAISPGAATLSRCDDRESDDHRARRCADDRPTLQVHLVKRFEHRCHADLAGNA